MIRKVQETMNKKGILEIKSNSKDVQIDINDSKIGVNS